MFFSIITMNLNWEILTINLFTFKRWDGIKDEKFWCYGGSLKNLIFKGVFTRNQHIGENCLKGGIGQFADLRKRAEAWQKIGGGVFEEGGWYTNAHYDDKNFLSIFPKMWNILFNDLLTNFCKSIFYVSAVNCYCTNIFKGSNYRFSGLLSRIYFKNSYFDASISNYL